MAKIQLRNYQLEAVQAVRLIKGRAIALNSSVSLYTKELFQRGRVYISFSERSLEIAEEATRSLTPACLANVRTEGQIIV